MRKTGTIWIPLLIVFFVLSLVLSQLIKNQEIQKTSLAALPTSLVKEENKKVVAIEKESLTVAVGKIVDEVLENNEARYSVVVKDLQTNEVYFKNEKESFKSLSLYKLWTMAVAYEQIRDGLLKETATIDGVINVANAIYQMITVSDNYTAEVLTNKIGLGNIAAFLKENGFFDSNNKDYFPVTTGRDIALFFEKLYKGELNNEVFTEKMIKTLKEQKLNEKLPKYLPKGTVIAHKTGEYELMAHDAGLVYTPKGNYIIVVLSEGDKSGDETIGQISKKIYEYFTN